MAKNDGAGFRIIILLMITFLCLGISFFQMARGYREFGGILVSGIFSFVLVLILFYLIFELHKARKERRSIWTIMSWYLFFVLLSFAGNFNSFYTFFMKNELLKAEVAEKTSALYKLRADAEIAFHNAKGINKNVAASLSDLRAQIESRNEPGCGPKCESILRDIESELGRKITRLKETPVGKNVTEADRKEALNKLIRGYEKIVVGNSETEALADIDRDIAQMQADVDTASKSPDLYALETTNKLVQTYNRHAINVKKLAGENFKGETTLAVDNAEVGKISQTFKSASQHLDHWGTWLSAFLALMIDLFVPLFILGFTRTSEGASFTFVKRGAENLS